MKNTEQNIKDGLVRAVNSETPNVMPSVLLKIEQQKGQDKKMNTYPNEIAFAQKKKKSSPMRWLAAAAVLVVLIMGGVTLGAFAKTDSTIYLDVNPGISIDINTFGKVTAVKAQNSDAEAILDGMNLKNVDLNVAVNALIGSMVKNGFISESRNAVLISVESNNSKSEQLKQDLMKEVEGILASSALSGAIASQTIKSDASLQQIADTYNISLGKAALVDLLLKQDPLLIGEEISKLSINEIYILLAAKNTDTSMMTQTGHASTNEYITQEKAKEIALAHAGVNSSDVTFYEIEFDYERCRMIYEIEFSTSSAEYDYEIDAITGEVMAFEHDGEKRGGSSNNNSSSFIGDDAAKAKALEHAGLSASDVTFTKCELDEDDGKMIYEIEFYTSTHEYEYEIDATTGAVLGTEVDAKNGSHRNGNHGNNNGSANNQNSNRNHDSNNNCPNNYNNHNQDHNSNHSNCNK